MMTLVVVVTTSACALGGQQAIPRANSSSVSQRTHRPAQHPSPHAKASSLAKQHTPATHRPSPRLPHSTLSEHASASLCPASPRRGVYHAYRLDVLGTCRRFVGTVIAVRHEQDGDYHVVIAPSPGFGSYLDSTNRSVQHGGIVAEIMPGQALRAPGVGAHVVVVGTWALDLMHGWN